MKNGWNRFVSGMINVLIVLAVALEISFPWAMPYFLAMKDARNGAAQSAYPSGAYSFSSPHYLSILIPTMIVGILSILILAELRKIMKTVTSGASFVKSNVTRLHRMGIYAMAIAVLVIVRCLIFFTLTILIIGAVFLIAGSFCFVLEQLFAQAVQYKEDDDLTI